MSSEWKPADCAVTDKFPDGPAAIVLIERDERRPGYWLVADAEDPGRQARLYEDEFRRPFLSDVIGRIRRNQGSTATAQPSPIPGVRRPGEPVCMAPSKLPADDTVRAIVAWQRANPQDRKVAIHLTGHVVEAHVTVIPDLATRKVKFLTPVPAARVGFVLQMAHLLGQDAVVDADSTTFGRQANPCGPGCGLSADLALIDEG